MANGVIQLNYQYQLSLADGRVYSYSGSQLVAALSNANLTTAATAAGADMSTQMISSTTGVIVQQGSDLVNS